jgi:hypothetical protein
MAADQPYSRIDELLAVVQRLAALREHRHTLAPFVGYSVGTVGTVSRSDPNGAAFRAIEGFLEREARTLARTIAGVLQ